MVSCTAAAQANDVDTAMLDKTFVKMSANFKQSFRVPRTRSVAEDGKPKRPGSAFALFSKDQWAKLQKKDGEKVGVLPLLVFFVYRAQVNVAEQAANNAAKWKAMKPVQKQVYIDRYQDLKAAFDAELAAWNKAHGIRRFPS